MSVCEEAAEGKGIVLDGVAEGGVSLVAGASEATLHGRLVGGEEFPLDLVLERVGAVVAAVEVIGGKDAMVDEVERQQVTERRTERLDEVEGQGGPSQ